MNSFSETQRFRQWWLWAILIGVNIASLISVYSAWSANKSAMPMSVIIGTMGFPLLIIPLFLLFRLDTTVDDTGVSYRFFPIHFNPVQMNWDEIEKAYVRQYRPIVEYGGWGIRYSFGNGKAFNMAGNMGLQLELKNGKKILIGTQEPDRINETLRLLIRSGRITNDTLNP